MGFNLGQKIIDILRGKRDLTYGVSKRVNRRILNLDLAGIFNTYCFLSDEYSKNLLLDLTKFKICFDKTLIPPKNLNIKKEADAFHEKYFVKPCAHYKSTKCNLYKINYADVPFALHTCKEYMYNLFVQKQYEYKDFAVEKGDYVIDGGACFGDTAMYFALCAGEKGKVYSFEFDPLNTKVFEENLELNPNFAKNIEIIRRPLWEDSKTNLYVVSSSVGTTCFSEIPKKYDFKVNTVSIDELVQDGKIKKVDYIKLDIEGCELNCLKGAKETIKKFKPKLAICIYHKDEDFVTIPKYIKELVPQYKLYIDHHTDINQETVLYAKV